LPLLLGLGQGFSPDIKPLLKRKGASFSSRPSSFHAPPTTKTLSSRLETRMMRRSGETCFCLCLSCCHPRRGSASPEPPQLPPERIPGRARFHRSTKPLKKERGASFSSRPFYCPELNTVAILSAADGLFPCKPPYCCVHYRAPKTPSLPNASAGKESIIEICRSPCSHRSPMSLCQPQPTETNYVL